MTEQLPTDKLRQSGMFVTPKTYITPKEPMPPEPEEALIARVERLLEERRADFIAVLPIEDVRRLVERVKAVREREKEME